MNAVAVRTALASMSFLVLAGCAAPSEVDRSYLAASIEARSGSQVSGSVRVSRHRGRIVMRATVAGLTPGAEHGFHLHEKGDCSAADGTSAGGHFNPHGKSHGKFGAGEHHAGDLPSLRANAKGVARVEADLSELAWDGPQGLKGRAVIVHAKADDFVTQPTGNSGARIGCAVIG